MSRFFERVQKKLEYNLECLICFLARAIGLRMIGFAVKELDP